MADQSNGDDLLSMLPAAPTRGAPPATAADPSSWLPPAPSRPTSQQAPDWNLHDWATGLVAGAYRGARNVYGGINRLTGGYLPLPPEPADVTSAATAYPVTAGVGSAAAETALTAPLIAAGGEGLGALGAAAADVVPSAARAIRFGTNLLSGELQGTSTLGNLLARGASLATQGAATGAAAGALTSGQSDQPVWRQALSGVEIGGALGPMIGTVGSVLGSVFKPLAARLSGLAADRQATGKIAEAMARDQVSPDDVKTAVATLGPQGTLLDIGGPNVRGLGETAANMPGPGAQTVTGFLEQRALGQQTRINDAIKAATGSQADFHDALDTLVQQRSQAAQPLYDTAFNKTVVSPADADALSRFVQDPIGQAGLQRGIRNIQLEKLANNQPFNPADYGVAKDANGNWTLSGDVPNLRLFDAVKRGMDNIAEDYRNPATGLMDFNKYDDRFGSGRAVDNLRKSYVADLRSRFPDYAAALDAYAGPSQSIDALTLGRRALSNDPEVTAKAVANLSDSDKQFFQAGFARALKDKVEGAADTADATKRIFGNQLIRDKIAAAFDDPDAFNEFQRVMQAESTFAKTRQAVLGGSPTARRLAAMSDVDVVTPALMAVHGHIPGAALNVAQQGANLLAQSGSAARRAAMARYLVSPPGDYFTALQRLNPLLRRATRTALTTGGVNYLNTYPP